MSKRKPDQEESILFAEFKDIKPPRMRARIMGQQKAAIALTAEQALPPPPEEPPLHGEAIIPETLAEYALGSPEQIFLARLKANSTMKQRDVCPIPPMVEVLSYVSRLEKQPPWFITAARELARNRCNYPMLPVLTREYLATGLEEADPGRVKCGRPPGLCESERLGGFRACALIMPAGSDVTGSVIMCYLCHLACSNKWYYDARDKSCDPTDLFAIHRFMVFVNQVGEYKLSMMLPGEAIGFQGIFGPFPIYNEQMYRVVVRPDTGRRYWVESDALVFRLPQAVSPQLAAGEDTASERKLTSRQFGHVSLSTANGNSQH